MFDTAIIGAGLAGTNAAIHLAQHGHQVLLLEAGHYPRPKVCGEFLSPESAALFAESGFPIGELNPASISRLRLTAPNGSQWQRNLPAPAFGLSRFVLDKALVDYAQSLGVTVWEGCRVSAIEGNLEDGFRLNCQLNGSKETFQAASVIAAYGKRSNLDKQLERHPTRQARNYIGLKQHFHGTELQQIDLHFFKGGYCGLSPVEDGSTNLCLLVRSDIFQEVAQQQIPQFIDWMAEQNPCLGAYLAEAEAVYPDWLSIAQVSLQTKSPLEGDILIAGDAVAMIAPLAGDGMAMALHSGKLAALALNDFLRGKMTADAMKTHYYQAWTKHFRQRLRLGRYIQTLILEPRFPSIQILKIFPALGDFLIKQTRDLSLLE